MLQSNAKLQVLAHTDRLTGVANRNQLDHQLDHQLAMEWQRHRREQKPIALLMIDADHFKAYNDCFGHLAGDRCLIRIAEAVKRTCSRPGDLLARSGRPGEREHRHRLPDSRYLQRAPQDLLASADAALYRAKADGPAGPMRATGLAGGAILQGVPLHRLR
jgi:PleD family two-component response regulator